MQDRTCLEVLGLLSEEAYATSEWLAEQMGLGMRTARKRIKELDDLLVSHGACIEAKPRYGYRLCVKERVVYDLFLKQAKSQEPLDQTPCSGEERLRYLLAYLLNHEEYVKSEDLLEFLYVSKGTLSGDLKQVEQIVGQFGLRLERRPNYGIKIIGREFDFRRCMGELFIHNGILRELNQLGEMRQANELAALARITLDCSKDHGIRFSEGVLEKFIHDIYIQVRRIRGNHLIDIPMDDLKGLNKADWAFVSDSVTRISELYGMEFPQEEKRYIALHLAGKRMVGSESQNEMNFVIREDIDGLAVQMLETVYQQTRLDFRRNFDLRMSLNQHLVPLDIRIRYDIPLTNPMLDDIKKKYMAGYTIAAQAAAVLKEYYQKDISEDETGYLALIFALALEQKDERTQVSKSNILVVCNSGKGISRLLMYRFKQVFDEYIQNIYVSSLFDLKNFDFSTVDYVFTTVPIEMNISVPIQEVGLFLEEEDIETVRRILESGNRAFLYQLYRRENFLGRIAGMTREAILQKMCEQVYDIHSYEPGLYESVMEREMLCSTDFGNLVAMPHPCKTMSEETAIFVAILDEPILWNRYQVQVVLLMLIGQMEENELQEFYEITTKYISDKAAIGKLVRECSYEALMDGLMIQG